MNVRGITFPGGLSFRNLKGIPQSKIIEAPIPPKVIIPMKQGFGNEAEAVVKPGDHVKTGQIIAINNESISNPVHSSVNGTIQEFVKIKIENAETNAAVIVPDLTEGCIRLDGYSQNWKMLSADKLEDLVYFSGAASLGSAGIPTRHRSSSLLPGQVKDIIVNTVASEPFEVPIADIFSEETALTVSDGLGILQKILPGAKLHIAISKGEEKIRKLLDSAALPDGVAELNLMTAKYPQSDEKILLSSILKIDLNEIKPASDYGVIILNIKDILTVAASVCMGYSITDSLIALSGTAWNENCFIKVPVGTPVQFIADRYLADRAEVRLIPNRLLVNTALKDLQVPITRDYKQLIAIPENRKREILTFVRPGYSRKSFSKTFLSSIFPQAKTLCETNVHGEERPCIFCGFCTEVCPVGIIPQLLEKYAAVGGFDKQMEEYGISKCINCNLCTYVCPSKIPVASNIKAAAEKLIAAGCELPQKLDIEEVTE